MVFFEILGFLTTVSILFQLFRNLLKAFYPLKDLSKRYGPGSWAVVTGASDGIGKGFAIVLARNGFSVCLVARNPEKLERVKASIQKQVPGAQIKCITADFKNSAQPGFFDKIEKELTGLDISLLVNNVGVAVIDYFNKVPEQLLIDSVVINLLPQVMLTRKLINRFLTRKGYKSGIVNVSSYGRDTPNPILLGLQCIQSL